MSVYINGTLQENSAFPAINHLGYGVFETFVARMVETSNGSVNAVILGLDLHLQRLQKGCEAIELSCPSQNVLKDCLSTALGSIRRAVSSQARIRIVVFSDNWFLQIESYDLQAGPIKLQTITMERNFPQVKSCSALVSVMAQKAAVAANADEALLVDGNNFVRETSWGNFFWIDKIGNLHTAKTKILDGVTRNIVLGLARQFLAEDAILEKDFKLNELHLQLECAFVTRSTLGVVPVTALDGNQLKGTGNELINQLAKDYNSLYVSLDSRFCDCFEISAPTRE